MVRSPNIRLAHSCGSLANCSSENKNTGFCDEIKSQQKKAKKTQPPVSALDQFKKREQKTSSRQRKEKKSEQRIIDLLTVKGNKLLSPVVQTSLATTSLSAALSVLRESCWYWGNISGERAKEVLKDTQPGTFLLRDSSDQR